MFAVKVVKSLWVTLLAFALLLAPVQLAPMLPFAAALGVGEAQAQDKKPQTLIELLRQRRAKKAQPAAKPKRATTTKRSTSSVTKKKRVVRSKPKPAARAPVSQSVAAPVVAAVDAVEKNENARRVLVVGDFVADGIAEGLEDAFADVASVIIDKRTNGSSGFVRDDYYNWRSEIGAILEDVKPDIVVVQLGSNDRQVMRVDGSTEQVRSDAWTKQYRERVEEFVSTIRSTNTLTVWVGAPPFKFRTMSADMLAFNEVYRNAVEARQGYFVDIWDGFVTESGEFSLSGSDVKGQTVQLRASDGINFTRSGKRKMAFYAERQLRLLLGDAAAPLLTSLAPDSLPIMKLPPLQTESELERTNPIAVFDPDFDGGAVLLGDMGERAGVTQAVNPLQAKSVRQRLVEEGSPPPVQPGRAGNFQWVDDAAETTSSTQLPLLDEAPGAF